MSLREFLLGCVITGITNTVTKRGLDKLHDLYSIEVKNMNLGVRCGKGALQPEAGDMLN